MCQAKDNPRGEQLWDFTWWLHPSPLQLSLEPYTMSSYASHSITWTSSDQLINILIRKTISETSEISVHVVEIERTDFLHYCF